jgi:two-component system CheB/CheR fusion protein
VHFPQGSPNRVLVVDDCRDSADSLALLTHLWGYETEACYNGAAALRIADRFSPQVVLLDLGLPGMDGFEVARRLQSMPGSQSALLVAISGWHGAHLRQCVREAGFAHYFLKPADPDELQELLSCVGSPAKALVPTPFRSFDLFQAALGVPLMWSGRGVLV